MAVVTVGERRQERGGGEGKDGSRQYTRVFCVTTNSYADGAQTVLAAAGIPRIGDSYALGSEVDSDAKVVSRIPKQIGPLAWEVEVEYDSKTDDKEDKQNPENNNSQNPEDWFEKVSVTFETSQEPVTGEAGQDYGGAMWTMGVVASNGEPFDPPAMRDVSRPVLTFEIYRRTFDIPQALEYVNAVNADVFWGADPRTMRITQYSSSGLAVRTIGDVKVFYWPITIEMKYRRETWDLSLLDCGTFYVRAADGQRVAFLTDDGQPRIGLLNGAGDKLADEVNGVPQFRTQRVYFEKPFAALGLPNME